MPESSHREVNLWVGASPESSTCASGKLPSMALDSGSPCRNDGPLCSFPSSCFTAIKLSPVGAAFRLR
ncbi:MAG: hypothetical protein WCI11_11100 [Candidatus Methylumidiphilus sp.]